MVEIIQIRGDVLEHAKQATREFDEQKTYNKMDFKDNYIGYLGEHLFSEWLDKQGANFQWINFVKQGWGEPDFHIEGFTVDLKTTRTDKLWIRKVEFDYYVLAIVDPKDQEMTLVGFIPKETILQMIEEDTIEKKVMKTGVAYIISPQALLPIEVFINNLKEKSTDLRGRRKE